MNRLVICGASVLAVVMVGTKIFFSGKEAGNVFQEAKGGKQIGSTDDCLVPSVRFLEDSLLQQEYGRAGGTMIDDLVLLQDTWREVQLTLKRSLESIFLAENRDFVRVLQGENRDRLAWLADEHPKVSDLGELVDRWGEPIFVHSLGRGMVEWRSAGADRVLWTKDDVVVSPVGGQQLKK